MANKDPLPSASLYSLLQELSSRLPAQVRSNGSAGSLQEITIELNAFVNELEERGESKHRPFAQASEANKLASAIVDRIGTALQRDGAVARKQVWVGAYQNHHPDPVLMPLGDFVNDLQHYLRIGLPLFPRRKVVATGKRAEILPQIEEIVPDQLIAPARFEFFQEVLHVRHDPVDPEEDAEIANAALAALLAAGERILERLKGSNCDPRLAETVELVQQALLSREDIVALGIINIEYRAIREEFEEELPKAINAVLKAHTNGIDSYLGQFPDWRKYSENAASAKFSGKDIDKLHSVVGKLEKSLASHKTAVANEVPEVIGFLNRVLKEPNVAAKQVAFALIRTIQNLASKVFHYGAAFLDDLITKTSKGSASALSKVAIIGLVGIVVDSIFGLSPIAGRIAEAGWMKEAAELIKVQLELLVK